MRRVAEWGYKFVTVGWGLDPHSRKGYFCLNLYIHFFALMSRQIAASSSATQHATTFKFGGKLRTQYLNTRFPLPNLLFPQCKSA